eukprot:c13065_g1_i1.p1 GENE.c13065_g1_i1~~c13065_g1_i1.p1  ORF type:complete len:302 (-),score=70.67 c13065_g1_i1:1369-2274(-)
MSLVLSVVTASSNSGSSCIRELLTKYSDKFQSVTAAFRSETSAQTLKDAPYFDANKVKVVVGIDARKPETLPPAFEGAHVALIVTPADPSHTMTDDAEMTANLVNGAVAAGVKHIVYVGSFSAAVADDIKIIASRFVGTEKLLHDLHTSKNIQFTILRGGYFCLNFLHILAPSVKQNSTIVLPKGFALPPVHTDAIGITGAAVLANPSQHEGKIYLMNGPEILNGQQIADTLSRVLDKPVSLVEVSAEDYIAKAPLLIKELILYICAKGVPMSEVDDVKAVAGRNITFEEWAQENKNAFLA